MRGNLKHYEDGSLSGVSAHLSYQVHASERTVLVSVTEFIHVPKKQPLKQVGNYNCYAMTVLQRGIQEPFSV